MQARDNRVITSDKALLDKLRTGVDAIANVTKRTMGPSGSNVIVEPKYGSPWITKDGQSVAKEVFLEDSEANMAVQLVKEAAVTTGDTSGDGTTTAVVLTQAIFHEALAELGRETVKPLELRKQITAATEKVVEEIKKRSRAVAGEELKRVAAISANDEDIGALVYDVLGEDPTRIVALEESGGLTTEVEKVDGIRMDRGFVSTYMVTDIDKVEAVMTDAAVLVVEGTVSSMEDIVPSMRLLGTNGIKTLLVLADDFSGDALQTLVVNQIKGSFNCLGVKISGFGEVKVNNAHDIAAVVGATVFSGPAGGANLSEPMLEQFGKARRVVATKEHTTIVGGGGDRTKLQARVNMVKKELEEAKSHFDKEKLSNRLAKLTGGVSLIKVGGTTESEIKELKQRVEDAVQAVVAAAEEGVLPGGGNALAVIANEMGEGNPGQNVVRSALFAPYCTILDNASIEPSASVLWDQGYDARTSERKESLLDAGIIDPAKVTRIALQNASSIAGALITSTASITFLEKAKSSRDV